ncbi:MAG: DUF4440 domain-containing protein [Candidatus Hodarchaeales archaeon]|jgi:hypothetical protein
MTNTPEIILQQWIEYVNKLEVDNIVSLYGETSTVLPTFSPLVLSNPKHIKEYFIQLSKRKNFSINLHNETLRKYEIGKNKYVLMGIYSFHFVMDDTNLTFPSRFTFIVDTSKKKPILHHHSSQVPRKLS